MLCAIDIDQTISSGYFGTCFQASVDYYRTLGVQIPATITNYHDLFQLPEVIPLHDEISGAREGVKQLSERGDIWYYTVRKHDNKEQEQRIHMATIAWLEQKQFPNACQVLFCCSVLNKLIIMHERTQARNEEMILVDDRWKKAIEAFSILDNHSEKAAHIAKGLRQRLTLVAYGAETVSHTVEDIRVVAFPSWSQVGRLVALFHEVN